MKRVIKTFSYALAVLFLLANSALADDRPVKAAPELAAEAFYRLYVTSCAKDPMDVIDLETGLKYLTMEADNFIIRKPVEPGEGRYADYFLNSQDCTMQMLDTLSAQTLAQHAHGALVHMRLGYRGQLNLLLSMIKTTKGWKINKVIPFPEIENWED
jgi:hypothetical protein